MSVQIQHRRGTAAANATFIGAAGELIWLTDEKRWVGHDGATAGGIKTARLDEVTAEVQRAVGNANFSFQITDRLVVPNAVFSAARTGTLPAASSVAAGRTISFLDTLPAINGANVLTVVRAGSDTINGLTSVVLSTPRGRLDLVSDGVSKWSVAVAPVAGVSRAITGLQLYNDTPNQNTHIGVTSGRARSSSGAVDITLPFSTVKRINANWTSGGGNGGLDTGTVAASTGYHLYIIWNPTTALVDVLISASATNPVMPSGFTERRRVGALMTDASANIRTGMWRPNGEFVYTPQVAHASSIPANAVNLTTLIVPGGVKMKARYHILATDSTTGNPDFSAAFRDPDLGLPSVITDSVFYKPIGSPNRFIIEAWTDTASRVYAGGIFGGATAVLGLTALGWTDLRDEYA